MNVNEKDTYIENVYIDKGHGHEYTKEKVNNDNTTLVFIDLDGTTLGKNFLSFNKKVVLSLKKLQEDKRIVICISTGKRYSSALKYYNELNLTGLLVSYNGAYITDPKLPSGNQDETFATIRNNVVRSLFSENFFLSNVINILIDKSDEKKTTLLTSLSMYWKKVYLGGGEDTTIWKKIKSIKEALDNLGTDNFFQIVAELHNDQSIIDQFLNMLKYGYPVIQCDIISKLKEDKDNPTELIPDKKTVIMRMRSIDADKYYAAAKVATYNNVKLYDQSIAFGDDKNDFKLIKNIRWGIAVKNASDSLKSVCRFITKFPNFKGGVAYYLNDFFGLGLISELDKMEND